MDTILTIISMGLIITALVLCICTWRALRPVSKSQPRAGYKHSALERRRKALKLATKAWLYSVEHGFTYSGRQEKEMVDRLEREIAALENELFNPKEEEHFAPKLEAPKRKPVTTVKYGSDDTSKTYYQSFCRLCGRSWLDRSEKQAEAKRTEHERSHA